MNPDLASWTAEQFVVFALMLTRVSVLVLSAPVLGNVRVPNQVKAGLSMVLTLLLYLTYKGGHTHMDVPTNILELTAAVMGEVFVGLAIGYTAFLLFSGIQMAGQIIDIQVGFGLVNVIDPSGGNQVSILGEFYFIISMLFFLAVDGHHALLKAAGDSFAMLPPGSVSWFQHAGAAGPLLAGFVSKLFIIAFQVAAPSIAVLFLTGLSMGLLSRTLPQMNVFIVGLPLNVVVGLLVTILSLKLLGTVIVSVSSQVGSSAFRLLSTLGS
jgi:flagellar biosynthetic protein FliR